LLENHQFVIPKQIVENSFLYTMYITNFFIMKYTTPEITK